MGRRLWLCMVTVGLAYGGAACTAILGDFPERKGGVDAGLDAPADGIPPVDGRGGDARHDVAPHMDAPGGDVVEDSPAFDSPTGDVFTSDAPTSDAPTFDAPPTDGPVVDTGPPDTGPPDSPPPTFNLKVDLAGTGTGTVTSSPSGIDCPATSCVMTVVAGTKVTLTETPAVGSLLGGWSGLCKGTKCVETMTTNKAVTVTFKLHTPTTWDATWSLSGVSYTGGALSVATTSTKPRNVRATVGKSTGAYYWEITATGGSASLNGGGIGLADHLWPKNSAYLGSGASSLGWGYGDGTVYMDWPGATLVSTPPATAAISSGLIYMFALDLSTGDFWAGQQGVWYNYGDPASAYAPLVTGISGQVYPAITLYGSSTNSFTANFGDSAFVYTPPTGFTPGFY